MAMTISRVLASRPVRVAMVIVALILILAIAAVVNVWSGLEQFVALPSWTMRALWLPLVLLLVVVVIGVIRGLWRLVAEERRVSQFPDIDWAWEEATLGLRKAGVALDRAPLILVLGEPANGIGTLFQASGMSFAVTDLPRRPNAPVRIYATRDAVFVACTETSVLARLAGDLAVRPPLQTMTTVGAGGSDTGGFSTTMPAEPTASQGRPGLTEPLTPSPTATTTEAATGPDPAAVTAKLPGPSVLSRPEEVESLKEQLRHLCGLIVRDRRPFCPVNGILALLPYSATNDDSLARQAGTACHLDVSTARTALGVSCPIFALLCNMEEAQCSDRLIRAYVSRLPSGLLGRPFPLVPDLDIPERVHMIGAGMEWICQSLVAPLVYRLFQLESSSKERDAKTQDSNAELIHFLAETHTRWQRLGRILGRVVSLDPGGDLMLGGCYVAATGQAESQQGFVAGVIRTILYHQNFVAWTTESLRQDRASSRRAALCNLASLGVVVLAVTVVYLFWVS
jgi:hypothetical protein